MKKIKSSTLYEKVADVLDCARAHTYKTVNFVMVQAYWNIGKFVVEEEQNGKDRADYGKALIKELAKKLSTEYGKGFNITNISYMRQFYLTFKKFHSLRGELSWTHYRHLLRVENDDARLFYIDECIECNWSTRQLERQIDSFYYERILSSKNKKLVKKDAKKNEMTTIPEDLIKDPYVLEFLNVGERDSIQEKELESALIEKLQHFLLELGKGFSFVARQKRISSEHNHFYIDLVFYNYILKCFVLIDLKTEKLTH
jgi:predicted nuclease of restriction endonuclease-like (RecB) superfamily